MDQTLSITIERALAKVNVARKATGLELLTALPKGVLEDPVECPLARALNFGCQVTGQYVSYPDMEKAVAVHEAWWGGVMFRERAERAVNTPQGLREFLIAFDAQKLPGFIDREDGAVAL